MIKRDFFLGIFLFTVIFFIYLAGISRSVYGGDSGDVILAAYFGGVAHPPGYPLNSLIGFLFTHLPIAGSVAYRANIMMAFFSAGTIVFLFLSLRNLFKNYFVALATSLSLAFTPLFWLYAHVTEVFQLNLFLASVSLYFLTNWISETPALRRKLRKADKPLFLSVFFLGLAVFHHQTSVLIIPAYVYLIYKFDKSWLILSKKGILLTLCFIAGGIPYLAVPLLALRQTSVNWDNAVNLNNLLQLITRSDYGSFVASTSFAGTSFQARLLQILSFFAFVKNDFTVFGCILIGLGTFYSYLKNRRMFWFLLWAIFFTGPFFLFYSSFSLSSDFLFGIWERFILLSYLFLTIYLGWGFYFLFEKATLVIKKIHLKKELGVLILSFSFFLLPLYMIRANWQKADMSKFELGDWLGHDVLVSSSPNSLIFLFDDTTAFDSQYVYYTSDEFRDRKLVLGGILRHLFYRQQLVREYPELSFPADFLNSGDFESSHYVEELAKANIDKFPVYSVDFSPTVEGHSWITIGLLKRLVEKGQSGDRDYVGNLNRQALENFSVKAEDLNSGYSNFIGLSIKRFYDFSFNEAGDQMMAVKDLNFARNLYGQALTIQPEDSRASFGIGQASLEMEDCQSAKNFLTKSYQLNKVNVRVLSMLAEEARRCEHNEDLAKQYEGEIKAILNSQKGKL